MSRAELESLIAAAVQGASPGDCLRKKWPEDLIGPVHVLALGKASLGLAKAGCELLGDRFAGGVVTAAPELIVSTGGVLSGWGVFAADHPLATERNVQAARAVLEFVRGVPPGGTLLVLVSGGGSAHLTLPAGSLTLEDVRSVTRALQRAGAAIDELNAVRKHCEVLKGGRLAAECRAGLVVTLAMSDVEGDRPDVIASGPTVADLTTYADALAVLERHGVEAGAVREHLLAGERGEHPETIKPGDPVLARTSWSLIANNVTVVDAVAKAAGDRGLFVVREHGFVSGDASEAGTRFGLRVRELAASGRRSCLIAGGEPVVNVGDESGSGGPSQEFALAAAIAIEGVPGVRIAALSTDGADGPPDGGNDHAGAIVDVSTVDRACAKGLDASGMLAKHDSATFFRGIGDAVRTGPTGTNLNHVFIGVTSSGSPLEEPLHAFGEGEFAEVLELACVEEDAAALAAEVDHDVGLARVGDLEEGRVVARALAGDRAVHLVVVLASGAVVDLVDLEARVLGFDGLLEFVGIEPDGSAAAAVVDVEVAHGHLLHDGGVLGAADFAGRGEFHREV